MACMSSHSVTGASLGVNGLNGFASEILMENVTLEIWERGMRVDCCF